ncbi:hypothetical protein FXO38_17104 [Capsicum annuum]|nr:hypothetical protein FXO38_17104 [Capsicum annuum]
MTNILGTKLSFLAKPHHSLHGRYIEEDLIPNLKLQVSMPNIRNRLLVTLGSLKPIPNNLHFSIACRDRAILAATAATRPRLTSAVTVDQHSLLTMIAANGPRPRYDVDKDEIGETVATFSSSQSLFSIFPAKDKQQVDHKEPLQAVVHGHFRALVLQLLQGELYILGKKALLMAGLT